MQVSKTGINEEDTFGGTISTAKPIIIDSNNFGESELNSKCEQPLNGRQRDDRILVILTELFLKYPETDDLTLLSDFWTWTHNE